MSEWKGNVCGRDGERLSERIKRGLKPREALALAEQIASGMAAAHEQNVTHGDLKPANVIVAAKGVAKIVDFGLANASSAARGGQLAERGSPNPSELALGDETLAATIDRPADGSGGAVRGTPAYLSPEQASGMSGTLASDVFSFGIMLYEMLTGRPAHPEQPILQMLLRLQNQDLASELAPQVGEPLRTLLSAMLARDPVRRPAMTDVLQAIRGAA